MFSVKDEHIFTLSEKLNQMFHELGNKAAISEDVVVDAVISLDDVNNSFVKELSLLAPFGAGNAKPLFAFKNVVPRKVEQFGKVQEHLKLVFETTAGSIEAIAFFAKAEDFACPPTAGAHMTLIGHVEQSFFMGRQQIRVRLVDSI